MPSCRPDRAIISRTQKPEGVQKNLSARVRAIRAQLPAGTPLELWWQDILREPQDEGPGRSEEHRAAALGTQGLPARSPKRSAHGVRLHLRGDLPRKGKGAGLILPCCATPSMNAHLAEISRAVDPGAHAVLILDGAGWHVAVDLIVPDNISLLTLPSHAPELNPVENVWQFLRDDWLGDRIFYSYENILDHSYEAWNKLVAQHWIIMSIGLRQWAYRL